MSPLADSDVDRALRARPAAPLPGPARADDAVLARLLIRMWSLACGRQLRDDVAPDQLSEAELIEFWADDMTASGAGRHRATPALPRDHGARGTVPSGRGRGAH